MSPGTRGLLAGSAAAGAIFLAHALPAATFIPPLRRRLTPRLSGYGRAGHLALTFDDGPDPSSTPAVLAALDRLGWRATFFMLGMMVDREPSLAREVALAGHEIALHGYDHISHLARSPMNVLTDVRRGFDAVTGAVGSVPTHFRPPYGILSSGSLFAASLVGLTPVLWSAWGKDWTDHATGETVMAELRRGLDSTPELSGPTVLLHDSHCTSEIGAWHSAVAVLDLLAEAADQYAWSVGPLSEHWS